MDRGEQVERWAASGAMALTGRADQPPSGPPDGFVPGVLAVEDRLRGHGVAVDGLALLGERAAIAGFTRRGSTSCGGMTRLLPTTDGWCAVALARPDDVDLVPAWLGGSEVDDPWPLLERAAAEPGFVARGVELGLPVATLGEAHRHAVRSVAAGEALGSTPSGPLVVDLSSLWAGPLCGSLLAAAGCDVVKVESVHRPDGARAGPPAFFALVNEGKASRVIDFRDPDGVAALRRLLADAEVVIEASRPRALRQLGLDAEELLATTGIRVWLSITGHGRSFGNRVAFGDDAAVAGGLVVRDERGPMFCADAVADPLTGLVAALEVLDRLAGDTRWLLDVSMAGVAASFAGPTLPVPPGTAVAPPRARAPRPGWAA